MEAGGRAWELEPGTLYAPDHDEEHELSSDEGMRLICVFNHPLRGDETHDPSGEAASGY